MNNKEVMRKVFEKYHRMGDILRYYKEMPAYQHQRLTQAFDDVRVQTSPSGSNNAVEKAIIREYDARYYRALIEKAVDMLDDTDQQPYKRIIKWRYIEKPRYTVTKICIRIGYSTTAYKEKLREASDQLAEILNIWGVNY